MQRTPRHLHLKSFAIHFVIVLTAITSISCAAGRAAISTQNSTNGSTTDKPSSTSSATPKPVSSLAVPALWEAQVKDSPLWSTYAAKIISDKCPAMIEGAKDIANFCPKYSSLTRDQKINVWVYLVSAIAKYESGFKPASRFQESGMGLDSITGQHVFSEGLLQLSYQDQQGYSFCRVFDWSVDRKLSPTDPNKTILNPELNLDCGIQILNHQIERYDQISIQSGAYWSTLRPSGTKVSLIKALVKGMGICR